MKKLLVAGLPKIYQICHVFRNGEDTTRHSPEFTMIEWYRAGDEGYEAIMNDCEGLLRSICQNLGQKHLSHKGHNCDPFQSFERLSVTEAFARYAKLNLTDYLPANETDTWGDAKAFAKGANGIGIRTADDDRWDDIFFRIMGEKIEPFLGYEIPCILYDYPAGMASLARRKPTDKKLAERFELYVCGIELANAFSELIDPAEQRKRFIEELDIKEKIYGERYPVDEDFIKALEYGMPDAGGIALGIDRLVMLAVGSDNISQVLWAGKP
jgi:lysyl-tRNA synthetase class 2